MLLSNTKNMTNYSIHYFKDHIVTYLCAKGDDTKI